MGRNDRIGFAIIGTGLAAELHRRAILANAPNGAELRVVGTRDPARPKAARQFQTECRTVDALFESDDIDVICICSPSGCHAQQALAAAAAGKHALVEKPLALNLADCDAMIEAFDKAGLLLGVAFQRRTDPLFQRVRQAIAAGDLGKLVAGNLLMPYFRSPAYYQSGLWRGTWALDGGGALINQGIHLVDLLLWFMGDPSEVKALGGTVHHAIEVEDSITALLHFPDNACVSLLATTAAAPGFPHRIAVYGTQGGIEIEGERIRRWDLAQPEKATVPPETGAESFQAGAGASPSGVGIEGHVRLIANFIETLRGNATLASDGRQGRRSLALILEIYKQAGLPR